MFPGWSLGSSFSEVVANFKVGDNGSSSEVADFGLVDSLAKDTPPIDPFNSGFRGLDFTEP